MWVKCRNKKRCIKKCKKDRFILIFSNFFLSLGCLVWREIFILWEKKSELSS